MRQAAVMIVIMVLTEVQVSSVNGLAVDCLHATCNFAFDTCSNTCSNKMSRGSRTVKFNDKHWSKWLLTTSDLYQLFAKNACWTKDIVLRKPDSDHTSLRGVTFQFNVHRKVDAPTYLLGGQREVTDFRQHSWIFVYGAYRKSSPIVTSVEIRTPVLRMHIL
jgi:hypothetical protein